MALWEARGGVFLFDNRDNRTILKEMLSEILSEELSAKITEDVYDRVVYLSRAVGARLGKPRSPSIATEVERVTRYAQGTGTKLANKEIENAINYVIEVLSTTCYPPTTEVARAIFDRKSGEPQSHIELVLLAARARWDIEIDVYVPIRWLAALGGVSVKTARNLASDRQLKTHSRQEGQVCDAREAARWLATRDIRVAVGSRRVPTRKGNHGT